MELNAYNRILVFGGSFDPPHNAHIALPRIAAEQIGADLVAYIPAAVSPHKQGSLPTAGKHRLNMLELALADQPWATILTLELEPELDQADRDTGDDDAQNNQVSYTIDTLEKLRAQLDDSVELRLLIGADQMRAFDLWHEPKRITELAPPVVMLRPPDTIESMLDHWPRTFAQTLSGNPKEYMVELPPMDVSSTAIRQRASQGLSLKELVHPDVEHYIKTHHLYR